MKVPTLRKQLLAAALLAGVSNSAFALLTMQVVEEIDSVGSPGSTVPAAIGANAFYEMLLTESDSSTETIYLEVELTSEGTGLTHQSITTGQGGFNDRVGITVVGADDLSTRTGTYTFSFFEDELKNIAFSLPDVFTMQVNDIDSTEKVTVETAAFSSVSFFSPTDLSSTATATEIEVTNIVGENTDKSDPRAIANFNGKSGIDSFNVTLAGESDFGREFQFEFTPVPEPSAYALLAGILALASVSIKRRRRS